LPQEINLKPINTFNKGLITEATVMTFPEGASSDELNCDLLKNGARQRRRAIAFEDNYQNSSFTVSDGSFVHKETWENVSGIGGKEFLVLQVNNTVYFYDKSPTNTSSAEKPFSINLTTFDVGNNFPVNETPISCSSITGYLVIVSAAINPIVVQYFSSSDTISVEPISVKIRDFEYLNMSSNISSVARTTNVVTITTNTAHELTTGDSVQIDCSLGQFNGTFTVASTPTTTTFTYALTGSNLATTTATGFVYESVWNTKTQDFPTRITKNYQYDLYNMGWSERGVFGNRNNLYTYWRTNSNGLSRSDYPPRNKPWWVGRSTASPYFNFDLFQNFKQGSTLAPNGKFILDFFTQNRSAATSGEPPGSISGLTTIVETARFNSTEAYAGRVWYAGLNSAKNGGKIFFSKIIESKQDFGVCYQKADPTAEDTEGLVDSDGGYIIIPDATNIVALFSTGSVLYVMANNGVWIIGGVDQVFKATEYYVSKLSNFGIQNPSTLVNVSGTPIYWSNTGIYAISTDLDKPSVQEISQPIKTFYDSISNAVKSKASSVFDRLNNRVYWLYSNEGETISNKKNNILILDMTLQAYFPWKISDTTGSTPYILDAYYTSGLGSESTDFSVLSGIDQVIDSSSNTVIETLEAPSTSLTEIKFIVKTSGDNLTFADVKGRDFLDWGSADYSSYAETGYDFYGSATLKKNTPYITSYLKRTEQNFVVSGAGYVVDYPSSCILTAKWDLSGDNSRWSNPSQIYRILNYPVADPDDLTFFYPYDTIVCRTKIRGKGRVMRLKFESETGKDFYLIGWEIISGQNPRY
jgi:hypothetical protein